MTAAWDEGYWAFVNGEPTANPYPDCTTAALEWEDGYSAAEDDEHGDENDDIDRDEKGRAFA